MRTLKAFVLIDINEEKDIYYIEVDLGQKGRWYKYCGSLDELQDLVFSLDPSNTGKLWDNLLSREIMFTDIDPAGFRKGGFVRYG